MKCTGHTSAGNPCKKNAIKGGNVCATHGGSAPQVRAKAMQRLLAAADPVAAELVELALTGEDPRVKVSAIKDLLDRAGVGEHRKVEVTLTDALLEEEIARLRAEIEKEGGQP